MFFRSAAAVSVVVGTAVSAQSSGAKANAAVRDTLAPVVITATRVADATAAPTTTTTVITGADLRAAGVTRVGDALRSVPGVSVTAGGSAGSQTAAFVRGGNSNYVLVLVDGVQVNDAGGFIDLANFTTDNVERIEVVRGPASVLYGSNAVSGVIHVFTHDGTGPGTLRIAGGAGSNGAERQSLAASGGGASVRYSISAARDATSGTLPFNNRYESSSLSGALRLAPTADTDLRIAGRWSAATFRYPTDYSGAIVDRNSELSDHRLTLSADAGHRFGERIELRSTLTSNEFLPRSNDGPDDAADTVGFYGYYSRSVRTRRAADVRMNVRGARQTLTIGVDAARERERSTSLSLSEYGPSNDAFEAARHTTGVYVQALGDATRRLSYVAGVRHDENSAFGSFGTLRAATAIVLAPGVSARAAVGSAFKAPSFYENFATGFVTGNPDLRPERSRSAEFGIAVATTDGALTVRATAYVQRFTNIVQYRGTAPSPGAPNYYNVAEADADGLELEAEWQATDALRATIAYSLADTRVTKSGFDSSASANYVKGERLVRRPPHTVTATAVRTVGAGSVRLMATRVGERADRDFSAYPAAAVTLPAYVKVDAAATIPLRNGLSALGRAENVLGARYDDIARYRAPGFALFLGLQYER